MKTLTKHKAGKEVIYSLNDAVAIYIAEITIHKIEALKKFNCSITNNQIKNN